MSTAAAYKKTTLARPKKRSELTEEQRQEIKEAFDLFDHEKTGAQNLSRIGKFCKF